MAAHGGGEAIQSDSRLKSKKPPSLVIAIPPPEQMMPPVSRSYPATDTVNFLSQPACSWRHWHVLQVHLSCFLRSCVAAVAPAVG